MLFKGLYFIRFEEVLISSLLSSFPGHNIVLVTCRQYYVFCECHLLHTWDSVTYRDEVSDL